MVLIYATNNNSDQVLQSAVTILKNGGLIAYPTETFYGLGAKFDMENSLKKLYEIKKRPLEKAMPLIIGDKALLDMVAADINRAARLLIDKFWPGPLTLILPAKENLSRFLTAATLSVAVRIPGESCALHLAKMCNFPITATSANPSGKPPAQDAETVLRYFEGKIDLIIDGGPAPGGFPSTIVDVTQNEIKIQREGALIRDVLYFLKG
jgi:L-threonylcarbamoyladenylate synthase